MLVAVVTYENSVTAMRRQPSVRVGRPIGWPKLWSYFTPFVDQSLPKWLTDFYWQAIHNQPVSYWFARSRHRWWSARNGSIFCAISRPNFAKQSMQYAREIAVGNVYRLTISCAVSEMFAIKLRSCLKSLKNYAVFGPPKYFGQRLQISDPIL